MTDVAKLEGLLLRYRADLERFLERHASGLLRYENAEDLVQGVHARALAEAEAYEHRGEKEFLGWLHTLARRYVADRHDYWSAMKRGSGKVLRLSFSGTASGLAEGRPLPPGSEPGPSTFASRRELLGFATKALAVLPERDRRLVRWMSEGVDLKVQAERLEISYAAAQRAGLRALERFRKAFELASQGPRG